ncbi:pentachlorophenol 4-monooxygenase [Penicillium tannophilum]|nr:pentachlorophenol 4-monooxygenase [Penicillium tannophilum]
MAATSQTDVLIIGGGPVGLLIAHGFTRQGVDSIIVEKHDKTEQAMYGRATTLYPRTLEISDRLELLDELNQSGYIARNSVTYKDGTPKIGNLYYDNARSAHERYTTSTGQGAVVVLRPDGILNYATALDDSGVSEIPLLISPQSTNRWKIIRQFREERE